MWDKDVSPKTLVQNCTKGLYYHHYLFFDCFWSAFAPAYLHNANNVLGVAVVANDHHENNRFPWLTSANRNRIINRETQLWKLFPGDDRTATWA
jgi:hypothetical protein